MCFSATASFVAAGSLGVAAAASIWLARNNAEKGLAQLPLLFGIQQFAEGFVWLSLKNPDFSMYLIPARTAFVLIAWLGWPVIIPAVYRAFIGRRQNHMPCNLLFAMGLIVAGINAWNMLSSPVVAEIRGHHIFYSTEQASMLADLTGAFYVCATLIPPFLSNNVKINITGIIHAGMFLFVFLFHRPYLVSVWCYLGAVSSATVLWVLLGKRKMLKN
jgi:hypothetical protein